MQRTNSYSTKQKDRILEVIKGYSKEFTIKDIYNELEGIGLTTIYRFVNKLEKDGLISKYIGSNNTTYYQYLEKCNKENHFYLKCDNCGKMEHIDCECIGKLSSHIFKEHKFTPSKNHIIINGLCEKCGEKDE